MPKITITLSEAMMAELETASARVCESGFTAETFASECVEVVLASRRLRLIAPGRIGARMKEAEPDTYRVYLPSLKQLS